MTAEFIWCCNCTIWLRLIVNLKSVFQSSQCIKSFFPYKDRINCSHNPEIFTEQIAGIVMVFTLVKLNKGFTIEKLNILRPLLKNDNTSAIADHVKVTGHNIKWDHFDILAKGKTDCHCKIKETLLIQELEPAFNITAGSEKLMLY